MNLLLTSGQKIMAVMWRIVPLALMLGLLLSACRGDDRQAANNATAEPAALSEAYMLRITGLVQDTLDGEAIFGTVLDVERGHVQLVVSMREGAGLAGGVYLVRSDTTMPEAGTYRFDDRGEQTGEAGGFALVYRLGLVREFRAYGGAIELTNVSRDLIEGRINARMRGVAYFEGRRPEEGEITIVGSFSAVRGGVGFIVGV
jgi:hypothetical protein